MSVRLSVCSSTMQQLLDRFNFRFSQKLILKAGSDISLGQLPPQLFTTVYAVINKS